ncbi:protein brawnin [Frankliniella occidentalis]|uniref:Protein brawnin n=1 Tax=Frankliniella occidentalis TaxID=133901 RepID=A0A9C6U9W4_FRAOC|nr:protein brawnin [Frankliniella occidentalis]
MPYGVPWPRFLAFSISALSSSLVGSQLVHNYYQPLADMDELIRKEVERLKAEKGIVDDNLK